MGQMFMIRYGSVFGEQRCFDEAAKQILIYSKHEKANTGLFYHGWTARPDLNSWADKTTGLSSEVWAEGLGWYALIITETLRLMPADHPRRAEVLAVYRKLANGLKTTQDPKTGGWFDIVDKGDRADNWIDPSGTAMFVYTLKRGIEMNLLDAATFTPVVARGYAALLTFASINDRGLVEVRGGCDGVSIQDDYSAYVNYRRAVNAKETYAGFLWATAVMETGWKIK